MLALFADPSLLESLRAAGVDAHVSWVGDHDTDSLLWVPASAWNMEKLAWWLLAEARDQARSTGSRLAPAVEG